MQRYGRMYGTFDGTVPVLLVSDPDLIREIFVSKFSSFSEEIAQDVDTSDSFSSKAIMYTSGREWKHLRDAISRKMTQAHIKRMIEGRSDTRPLVNFIRENTYQRIRLTEQLTIPYALTMISYSLFGIDFDLFHDENREAIISETNKITGVDMFANHPYSSFWLASRLPPFISRSLGIVPPNEQSVAFYVDLLEKEIRKREKESAPPDDLLQSFLKSLKAGLFTEDHVLATVIHTIANVNDAVSDTLSSLLHCLARHPLEQRIAQREIDEHMRGDQVTAEAISKLVYLEACIMETMRLYTVEVRQFRGVTAESGVTLHGIHLPKGTVINVPSYALHRDPDFWPEPHAFIPERFLPGRRGEIAKCSFMPFGLGPRMCPGDRFAIAALKLCLVHILKDFSVSDPLPEDFTFPANFLKASTCAFTAVFTKRNENISKTTKPTGQQQTYCHTAKI